ncbi:uncharacterized protein MELLADRAFT_46368 [Melampsora larici-populina 98AG31]|uniref:Phosphodiest-domain-containing protein n=1 Tax=Melampsora larici-populina (strain 98AG31 / pathotype 3-4-7) TaxID=747676 RepID=F4R3T2_MELLP|nr:uncharacterized protein MELLADRAFT_46368 [Melampsora larici-populina 98AG31]EGG12682.1 hypothetical protein MELLADRAFT_46368 [Melampsora larici-populina 98AG31]
MAKDDETELELIKRKPLNENQGNHEETTSEQESDPGVESYSESESESESDINDNQSRLINTSNQNPIKPRTYLILSTISIIFILFIFSIAPHFSIESISKTTLKQIKPIGPPGSITSNTEHWASQGGTWNNVDLDEKFKESDKLASLSNSTHHFKKTLIVVSLDGFRLDYLDRNLTSNLISLTEKGGLRAKGLKPQFPSLTFPNHWSMLTGLYPESHGIVSNNFYDPNLDLNFTNTNPSISWDSYWWGGEPIWSTASKNQMKTAVMMWPGPPYTSEKIRPTYWRAFQEHFKWSKRIQLLESWLDMPIHERPELIFIYLPDLDEVGHRNGAESSQLNQTLIQMNHFVNRLDQSLSNRNLSEIVDVVYVSDHGMSSSDDHRLIYLDQILGSKHFSNLIGIDGWPAAGLRFKEGYDLESVLKQLDKSSQHSESFKVYTHETMPDRWHFSNNQRIAPIYIVPSLGWVVTTTQEHKVEMKGHFRTKGIHGYDNDLEEMQGIFFAYGPSFRKKSIKSNLIDRFSNLEIYSLIIKLLNITDHLPKQNSTLNFWDQYL